jgi:hypothetical protein
MSVTVGLCHPGTGPVDRGSAARREPGAMLREPVRALGIYVVHRGSGR